MKLPPSWIHVEGGREPTKATMEREREAAKQRTYAYYDAHPGGRRLPAREAFEVYDSRFDWRRGGWVLFVRRRARSRSRATEVVVHGAGPGVPTPG